MWLLSGCLGEIGPSTSRIESNSPVAEDAQIARGSMDRVQGGLGAMCTRLIVALGIWIVVRRLTFESMAHRRSTNSGCGCLVLGAPATLASRNRDAPSIAVSPLVVKPPCANP